MASSNLMEMTLPLRGRSTSEAPASAGVAHNFTISTASLECTTCQQRRWLDCDKATNPELCTPCREFGGHCSTSKQSMSDAMYKDAMRHELFGDVNPPTPRSGEGAKPPKRVEDHKLPPGWQPSPIDLQNAPALPPQVMYDPFRALEALGQDEDTASYAAADDGGEMMEYEHDQQPHQYQQPYDNQQPYPPQQHHHYHQARYYQQPNAPQHHQEPRPQPQQQRAFRPEYPQYGSEEQFRQQYRPPRWEQRH